MGDVRRAAELAGDDAEPRTRRMKVRAARPLHCLERHCRAQKLLPPGGQSGLSMRCFGIGLGEDYDIAAPIYRDRRAGVFAPQAEVKFLELPKSGSHCWHRDSRNGRTIGCRLRLT
jgi:hypothetical protein